MIYFNPVCPKEKGNRQERQGRQEKIIIHRLRRFSQIKEKTGGCFLATLTPLISFI
jgi:hypothetical protein